jgi:hypothetical protein
MSIQNYEANKQELVDQAGVPPEVIFDYEFSPYVDLFDHFFEFCRENLLIHEQQFQISPARFFYENERIEVNACAMTIPDTGYSLLMMTAAMQVHFYDHFYRNNNCFDVDQILQERYGAIFNEADPPGYIMYQISIQFTYYHELAHLIQRSNKLPTKLQEKYGAVGADYQEYQHILEFDADCHAANFMIFHILQYVEGHREMANNAETIQHIISLYAATIFIYFTFLDGGGPIYYRAGDHPHPINRIIYITNLIVEAARLNLGQIELDRIGIIREAFDMSERFYAANGMANPVERFDDIYEQESAQIAEYIVFLSHAAEQYPELTRNRLDANGNPI